MTNDKDGRKPVQYMTGRLYLVGKRNMKAKRVKAFCVVENDNEIFVYSAHMPIYWRKVVASDYAKVQNQIGNPCDKEIFEQTYRRVK